MIDDRLGDRFRPQGSWLDELGLVFDEQSGERMTAHLDLDQRHHTPWGVVHGGVYTTIVETIASVGGSLAVIGREEFAVGVANSTDFFRSIDSGRVDVVAVPVHQGRTQQVWTVDITRAGDGKLVAQGRLRLQNVPLSRAR
ncbi:MAG TPA: PaaI family thioesterase [Acidimicrobiales bacterium]|nr:PaaI family thioesterase [Acidimicrobiales bacterium]